MNRTLSMAPAHFATPDLDDLRVAFQAMCDMDFSDADLPAMTAEATRQMHLLESDTTFDGTGGAAFQVSVLRELVALATGRDLGATLH